jgi:hypothetical protein
MHAQFSALETGINSFAVSHADTLKDRRHLVKSRLWWESLLDRAKKSLSSSRSAPAPPNSSAKNWCGATFASPDPCPRRIRAGTLAPTAETNHGRFVLLPAPAQARAASKVWPLSLPISAVLVS